MARCSRASKPTCCPESIAAKLDIPNREIRAALTGQGRQPACVRYGTHSFHSTALPRQFVIINMTMQPDDLSVQAIIAQYNPYLERVLTPKRLEHSLGVMQVMASLADIYALDREQALTAGLLHDAAKDLDAAGQEQVIRAANIPIHCPTDLDYHLYLHGPAGAYLARAELGVTDPHVLDAIAAHSYYDNGSGFNAPLAWCLRFADILEPYRNWSNAPWMGSGLARLRAMVYLGQMEKAALLQSGLIARFFTTKDIPLHPNIQRAEAEFSARLGLDERFFEPSRPAPFHSKS